MLCMPAADARTVIRVGGPSTTHERKVAIVAGDRNLRGERYSVIRAGARVEGGQLRRAPGNAAPFAHAYVAPLRNHGLGEFRVRVGRLSSPPWTVTEVGSRNAIGQILRFFDANRDGAEPSDLHGPAHLNDAVIHPDAVSHGGVRIAIAGGWMDAGDMLHFTQTTAFATAALEAAARLDPADAAALEDEADVGVRWLLAAHPFPDAFVAQVGDERDHELGFRDAASDDGSAEPGIGTRFAYTLPPDRIGGDLGGKAAAALAMAYQRSGAAPVLAAARDWYEAGALSAAPAPRLDRAGYPSYAGAFYVADRWKDSMATGALELWRATGEQRYLDDFADYISSRQARAEGTIGVVDGFGQLGAADACGSLGLDSIPAAMRGPSCALLVADARIAGRRARSNAFGMPGFFTWGTTAQNGAAGALAAMAGACATAANARDYLLGRNPFGRSFVVGYGPKAALHPHHWASVLGGAGQPQGAVVGGPAPIAQIRSQGFDVSGPFQSRFASYEDERADYVTSEPALDYAAASILLLAALDAHC
jgi:endoglucanase